jgi:CheY-like chemotaxis protein
LQTGLARRGFEVIWRTSAAEALAAMSEGDFDVIVTDLNMPTWARTVYARRAFNFPGFCRCRFFFA